ncbi:hypothetical protein DFJ43DRAFT_1097136 [Lentinula guzmanii]|uniref:Uncharacterized protein n=1 Tax=Lentinula guzmanii TaxID=2804957 RepID=A0AA38MWS1_9AGAR|nr:hypothetical protein DFJ43DRAFT_1097136 [Lentinula guzmanii]
MMRRAITFAFVAILALQTSAAVISNARAVSLSLDGRQSVDPNTMLEVRGFMDKLKGLKEKIKPKKAKLPVPEQGKSENIRPADTPNESKHSLNDGDNPPKPKHGKQRKMGPLAVEGENPPENPDMSPPNDTSKAVDSSDEPASPPKTATSKGPSHHHHHRPHRESTSNANPGKDSEVTLKPSRQRGSTVTGTGNPKPNMQRVNSGDSDYAVTISSEQSGTAGTKNDVLSPPHTHRHGHHRGPSVSSQQSIDSNKLGRTASSASRGRGRPGSMHSQKPVDKSRSRADEEQKAKDRAEQRLSALYVQQTAQQAAQTAQTDAARQANAANVYAVTGNTAATNPGMMKPPGMS